MLRSSLAAITALALGVSFAAADEVKGKVKKVDAEKNTLTITVDGKDTTYSVAKDASFVVVSTAPGKKKGKTMEKVETLEKGLAGISAGNGVTVLSEKQGDKDVISSVKVTSAGGTTPAKKAKKAKKSK